MLDTVVVVIWAGSTVSRSTPTATRKVPAAHAGPAPAARIRPATTRVARPRRERRPERAGWVRMSPSFGPGPARPAPGDPRSGGAAPCGSFGRRRAGERRPPLAHPRAGRRESPPLPCGRPDHTAPETPGAKAWRDLRGRLGLRGPATSYRAGRPARPARLARPPARPARL